MKSFCFVAALAVFGMAHGALADNSPDLKPYSLRLEMPSDSVSCNSRANSLGDSFAAETGLTVTSATCQGTHSIVEGSNTYTTVTIVIDYMAASQALPYQAIYGGSEFISQPSAYSGLFATYGDCLKARGAQEAAFTVNAGLQVFAAYCTPSEDETTPGYSLVVEAFGTPKAVLYSFTQDPILDGATAQVMKAAQQSIIQRGGTVTYTDDTHVFYYAPYSIDVGVRDLGFYSDASQCQTQTTAVQAIFTQGQAQGVSALCVASSDNKHATLTVVAADASNIIEDYGYSSQRYTSFTECMGDLSRVLQNAQSNNENVLGAICKPSDIDSSVFVADIYSAMN